MGGIEAEDEDLPEAGHPGTRLNMVLHNGQARHREQWLGHVQRQRPETRSFLRACHGC
jgi:hypothetical protein